MCQNKDKIKHITFLNGLQIIRFKTQHEWLRIELEWNITHLANYLCSDYRNTVQWVHGRIRFKTQHEWLRIELELHITHFANYQCSEYRNTVQWVYGQVIDISRNFNKQKIFSNLCLHDKNSVSD